MQSFAIENERLTASLRDGTTATCELYSFETFYEDLNDLVVEQNKAGIIEAYDYHADHSTNWVEVLLPYVLAIMGFILLLNLMNRMNGGGAAANDKMAPLRRGPHPDTHGQQEGDISGRGRRR